MQASDWVALCVGLGGLLLGAWGMWLGHRSQSVGLQLALHEAQIAAALEICQAITDLWDAGHKMAYDNAAEHLAFEQRYTELLRLSRRYHPIMPDPVIEALSELAKAGRREERSAATAGALDNVAWEVVLRLRDMVGTDPLTRRTRELLYPIDPALGRKYREALS